MPARAVIYDYKKAITTRIIFGLHLFVLSVYTFIFVALIMKPKVRALRLIAHTLHTKFKIGCLNQNAYISLYAQQIEEMCSLI